jgi:hypothetical protein
MFDVEPSQVGAGNMPAGFRVERAQVQFVGLCADCSA